MGELIVDSKELYTYYKRYNPYKWDDPWEIKHGLPEKYHRIRGFTIILLDYWKVPPNDSEWPSLGK